MKFTSISFIFLILLLIPVKTNAGQLLSDGFESGDLSGSTGDGSWTGTQPVSSTIAKSGTYSLKFLFEGGDDDDDAWAEQRANLPQTTEIWGKIQLYIPSDYYHRNVSPNNNKIWAIYASPYGTPGFQINLSTGANADGTSSLYIHIYNDGTELSPLSVTSSFITASDLGTWIEIKVRVKVPTSSTSNDGIIQVWKNGTQIADYTSLDIYGNNGRNYIDQMFLLGWSNSGFDNDTIFYIDDVVFSTTRIGGSQIGAGSELKNIGTGNSSITIK